MQGQTEYYAGELLLNSKLRVFAVNCSLLYGGHNTVHAQLHVKSKRGHLTVHSSLSLTHWSVYTRKHCPRSTIDITPTALSWYSTTSTPTRTRNPTPTRPTRLHILTSDREDPREEIACVGRKAVAVFGESVSVSVSVSAPWNASFTTIPRHAHTRSTPPWPHHVDAVLGRPPKGDIPGCCLIFGYPTCPRLPGDLPGTCRLKCFPMSEPSTWR